MMSQPLCQLSSHIIDITYTQKHCARENVIPGNVLRGLHQPSNLK